jgi:hypothetical protein
MKEREQNVFGPHYTQQMHKNIKEAEEGNEGGMNVNTLLI